MQLVFCVLSERVESAPVDETSTGALRLNLSGVIGVVRPLFMPGQYSFAVSLGLRGIDRTVPHNFRMVIRDPEGAQVSDLHGGAPAPGVPPQDRVLPPEDVFGVLSFQAVNIPFRTEGRHTMDIWFDDEMVLDSGALPVYMERTA